MPVTVKKLPGRDSYRVSTPEGVRAKGTTKAKAKRLKRLLQAVKHGFVPTGQKGLPEK